MYLIICEPGKLERLKAYAKMPSLREMQQIVGGHLEVVTPDGFPDGVRLVCNEDGKGLGLPVNRWVSIGGRRDVIVGTCFFCAVRENEDGERDLALLDREQADAVVRAMNLEIRLVKKDEIRTCVLCHETFTGEGNNAAPLAEGRCCDLCNMTRVIPERMKRAAVPSTTPQAARSSRLPPRSALLPMAEVSTGDPRPFHDSGDGEGAVRSIAQQLEDIAAEICDKYCKYMVTAQGEDDLARHCDKCPLVRLVS